MTEMHYQELERHACAKVSAAILLPQPEGWDMMGIDGFFDPWDLFPSLYGSYSGDFDRLAIEVLTDVLNRTYIRDDLAGLMFREMLCTADLCAYGSSPRVCFPTQSFRELLPDLISKWRAFSIIQWGCDVTDSEETPCD